ncbi:DUF6412 domain-containing protein [Flexivirga sp.]|uniref:DUF6412 domain-containing protein n=1 Tax=Flexivirga sp. TaxID=1962927 RepID=UPI003F7D4739
MRATESVARGRERLAVLCGLLSVLALAADTGPAPALAGVVLAGALLLSVLGRFVVPVATCTGWCGPHGARAPDAILPSTHPAAAGHPKPRAPGAASVAPA